ncbi:hypothetical protein [Bradyrhizobium archetypum]|jgi:hypothetical protein|uniref:Secreted protein n=1 Tax=Bradyrhizobium archetypum TaxID=2721160 RepID=A0A7Y4M026_9BRAD|nr:hypothetical protein [Bradyrhizobium archetypum]NOJ44939.1 hypothetical protein [Bradyrhizobium archetypum]
MHIKFLTLLIIGTALSGCCASGTGCSTPTATGAPIAWDGLGEPPTADGEQAGPSKPKRRTARNRDREIILGPLNEAAPRETSARSAYEEWTRLPNEDPEADARLKRQIKICRDC